MNTPDAMDDTDTCDIYRHNRTFVHKFAIYERRSSTNICAIVTGCEHLLAGKVVHRGSYAASMLVDAAFFGAGDAATSRAVCGYAHRYRQRHNRPSHIIDVSPHAREHGIETGMLVWAARRQCRWLHAIADDADATAAAIERIETVLVRHSHVVTNDRPGRWTFSLAALGSAYGQATAIAEGLLDDVWHTTGFHGGIGLAAQPGIAKIAAALTANQGGSVVVLPGTEAAFLAPLTVTVLPSIGAKTQVALTRLGVTTIGHLANVPPGISRRYVAHAHRN